MSKATVYVHPGERRCRVYYMPYTMSTGQHPLDIAPKYQAQWREIAMLNQNLELVYVADGFQHLASEIEGQMGGTYFDVEAV